MEVKKEGETVYKNSTEESHLVMNDKVQALAGSIYEEFEKMISKYDPDVVKDPDMDEESFNNVTKYHQKNRVLEFIGLH